ncbi:hypothetical protein ACJX0J_034832, partial [Zea mays]
MACLVIWAFTCLMGCILKIMQNVALYCLFHKAPQFAILNISALILPKKVEVARMFHLYFQDLHALI